MDAHKNVVGVLDIVHKCAYDAAGKKIEIPADKADYVEEAYAALMENVAETSEAVPGEVL